MKIPSKRTVLEMFNLNPFLNFIEICACFLKHSMMAIIPVSCLHAFLGFEDHLLWWLTYHLPSQRDRQCRGNYQALHWQLWERPPENLSGPTGKLVKSYLFVLFFVFFYKICSPTTYTFTLFIYLFIWFFFLMHVFIFLLVFEVNLL